MGLGFGYARNQLGIKSFAKQEINASKFAISGSNRAWSRDQPAWALSAFVLRALRIERQMWVIWLRWQPNSKAITCAFALLGFSRHSSRWKWK